MDKKHGVFYFDSKKAVPLSHLSIRLRIVINSKTRKLINLNYETNQLLYTLCQ